MYFSHISDSIQISDIMHFWHNTAMGRILQNVSFNHSFWRAFSGCWSTIEWICFCHLCAALKFISKTSFQIGWYTTESSEKYLLSYSLHQLLKGNVPIQIWCTFLLPEMWLPYLETALGSSGPLSGIGNSQRRSADACSASAGITHCIESSRFAITKIDIFNCSKRPDGRYVALPLSRHEQPHRQRVIYHPFYETHPQKGMEKDPWRVVWGVANSARILVMAIISHWNNDQDRCQEQVS